MSSDLAIRVQGVSKAYHIYERPQDRLKQMFFRGKRKFHDEFWALRDVSFEVGKGETVGIVGRNGSGKSTLLQIICGTVNPTMGSVERHGRVSALLELGSGFNPEFTGRENVYLNGSILGLDEKDMSERFDEIAAFADIGDFIDSPVKNYSSGMFARLAFSVAIHVDPDILIVDEILAVGDAAFQRRCMRKFYEVRDRGCSILFVSHDQYQVKSICQRALYLKNGRQQIFGPAGRVIDQYMIEMESSEASAQAQNEDHEAVAVDPSSFEPVAEVRSDTVANATAGDEADQADAMVGEEPLATKQEHLDDLGSGAQFPYRITAVRLLDSKGEQVSQISTGDEIAIEMDYVPTVPNAPERISFVFNLYRHDGFYVCGTTTLMDGVPVYKGGVPGTVRVEFPSMPLLSGRYKWRMAINDHGGFCVLAEAKEVGAFELFDDFDAVGLVNIPRVWKHFSGPVDTRMEGGSI